MITIVVAHNKGGVGKSTLCLNLAIFYKMEGVKVGILDVDPQGSLVELKETFDSDFVDLDIMTIPKNIDDIETLDYDVLIIDTPPVKLSSLDNIFALASIILIPTKAGVFDRLAVVQTIDKAKEVQKKRPALKICIVLNQVIPNNSYIQEMTDSFKETKVLVLPQSIGNRIAFSRSLMDSKGIFSEKDNKAKEEIKALGNALIDLVE